MSVIIIANMELARRQLSGAVVGQLLWLEDDQRMVKWDGTDWVEAGEQ